MNKAIYSVVFAILLTGVNVAITTYLLSKHDRQTTGAIADIKATIPKFIIVDEGLLNRELKVQPDGQVTTSAQLLADRQNLFTALKAQNYYVISNTQLLSYPVSNELDNVNMPAVRKWLKDNAHPISTASEHEATVNMAQKLLDREFTLPTN